jgi:hypothetical protein
VSFLGEEGQFVAAEYNQLSVWDVRDRNACVKRFKVCAKLPLVSIYFGYLTSFCAAFFSFVQ